MEKTRVNIAISNDLKDWFQSQAEGFGCSMSAMMVIALAQYKQQSEGLAAMNSLSELKELMEQIQKKGIEGN
jgi:hypothetical protein